MKYAWLLTHSYRREFKIVVLNGRAQYVTGQKEGRSVRDHCVSVTRLMHHTVYIFAMRGILAGKVVPCGLPVLRGPLRIR